MARTELLVRAPADQVPKEDVASLLRRARAAVVRETALSRAKLRPATARGAAPRTPQRAQAPLSARDSLPAMRGGVLAKGKRISGGVIPHERRMNVSLLAGRGGELAVRDLHREESPGPGSYNIAAGRSALTPRSARISDTLRRTSEWLEAECAPGVPTPAPVMYDVDPSKGQKSKRSASAVMLTPRDNCIQHGDVIVHDLRRESSPGPGSYQTSNSTLSPRHGASISSSARPLGELLYKKQAECSPGVPTPGPMSYDTDRGKPSMKHSVSAAARMQSPRFQCFLHGDFTVHDLNPKAEPGPGSYDTTTGRSALTPRSARIGYTARSTDRWATQRGECAPNVPTPSPGYYDVEAGSRKTSSILHRAESNPAASARMLSPRGNVLLRGDVVVQDLRRSSSPGPGSYDTPRGALTPRSARIGETMRRTESWAVSQTECAPGLVTPGPADYAQVLTYEDASQYGGSVHRGSFGNVSRSSLRSSKARSQRTPSHASLSNARTPMRESPAESDFSRDTSTFGPPNYNLGTPTTNTSATPVRVPSYTNPTYSSETKRAHAIKSMQPRA